ncbi:hypothetical protein [Streptomyces coffeae]|uniref:4-hydroxyphenyl-beta-ketoacyl-CoA hydrolase n=1 Tax=Streptomyces coffeae TaxID=621382 RepID=A0ABS1NS00_9ACTN|nr:hypothetical protein [Streptomyces coffeae]MBL1102595.1 hypothetical protein [Streptomyces coffeae]
MDLSSLDAIDVHVHVEQDSRGRYSLDSELLDASADYFRSSEHRTPTISHIAQYYRARRTAAVVFAVDATWATGHPALWVPINHPCSSGSMLVLVEGSAESVSSADFQVSESGLLRDGCG